MVRKRSGIRGRERQQKLFDLFSSGFTIKSPEVKELQYRPASLRGYYRIWQKRGGIIPSPETPAPKTESNVAPPQPKTPAPKVSQRAKLPGGESIEGISDIESQVILETTPPDKPDKPDEEKPKEEKKEIPTSIIGSGLTATVKISIKTLALYEIARNIYRNANGGEDMALGDFLDICVEDTYRGRGKDLGLINLSK